MATGQRHAKDLFWAMGSPGLLANADDISIWPDDDWYAARAAVLEEHVVRSPEPPHAHRFHLGTYFEDLIACWLEIQDEYRLISRNLQVREGKRTIGEFDFLVARAGHHEHWEAAIKFYLGHGPLDELSSWIGPNTADRLDVKLERLVTRQLHLSRHPAARELLAREEIQVGRARCLMKGRFYYPYEAFVASETPGPPLFNPTHQIGWWLTRDDFAARFRGSANRFLYLPKSRWLAEATGQEEPDALSHADMLAFIDAPASQQATQVALVTDGGEVSRGFVVDERWLAHAAVSHHTAR